MNKTILILEENSIVHGLVASALDVEGLILQHEFDPSHYAEKAQSLMPDLILISNEDSQRNYAVCRQLVANPQLNRIPRILLANSRDTVTPEIMADLGLVGLVRKPFEASDLQQQVSRFLNLTDFMESASEYRAMRSLSDDGKHPLNGMKVLDADVLGLLHDEEPVPHMDESFQAPVPEVDFGQELAQEGTPHLEQSLSEAEPPAWDKAEPALSAAAPLPSFTEEIPLETAGVEVDLNEAEMDYAALGQDMAEGVETLGAGGQEEDMPPAIRRMMSMQPAINIPEDHPVSEEMEISDEEVDTTFSPSDEELAQMAADMQNAGLPTQLGMEEESGEAPEAEVSEDFMFSGDLESEVDETRIQEALSYPSRVESSPPEKGIHLDEDGQSFTMEPQDLGLDQDLSPEAMDQQINALETETLGNLADMTASLSAPETAAPPLQPQADTEWVLETELPSSFSLEEPALDSASPAFSAQEQTSSDAGEELPAMDMEEVLEEAPATPASRFEAAMGKHLEADQSWEMPAQSAEETLPTLPEEPVVLESPLELPEEVPGMDFVPFKEEGLAEFEKFPPPAYDEQVEDTASLVQEAGFAQQTAAPDAFSMDFGTSAPAPAAAEEVSQDFLEDLEALRSEIAAAPRGETIDEVVARESIMDRVQNMSFSLPKRERTFSRAMGIFESPQVEAQATEDVGAFSEGFAAFSGAAMDEQPLSMEAPPMETDAFQSAGFSAAAYGHEAEPEPYLSSPGFTTEPEPFPTLEAAPFEPGESLSLESLEPEPEPVFGQPMAMPEPEPAPAPAMPEQNYPSTLPEEEPLPESYTANLGLVNNLRPTIALEEDDTDEHTHMDPQIREKLGSVLDEMISSTVRKALEEEVPKLMDRLRKDEGRHGA